MAHRTVRPRLLSSSSLLLFLALGLAAASPARDLSTFPEDWRQVRTQFLRQRFAVSVDGEGRRAANPVQRWTTRFDGEGFLVTPHSGGWTWGLALEGWGRTGGKPILPGSAVAEAGGNRLAYRWSADLEEWFVNRPSGLEHGFTLARRPAGEGSEARLQLRVRGGLAPATDGRDRITFADLQGNAAIRYEGLHVWDARGRSLAARMTASGQRLVIAWDDSGAQYPVTVDPVAQQAYFKASNTQATDEFGSAVAIDGDTAVVGAPKEDSAASGVNADQINNLADGAGAAYVFVRVAGVWTQQAYLKAWNAQAGAAFGASVSIAGDTIVVGAPGESDGGAGSGAIYVFKRSGSVWTQQVYLKASNAEAGDEFGTAVAISGDTIVAGAPKESSGATGVNGDQANNNQLISGAAYVFVRSGTSWTQQAYLKASNAEHGDQFGTAVAISAETVVVGANGERSNATGVNGNQSDNSALASGAVYVFTGSGASWTQQAYLKASNTGTFDDFGSAVAISGDTIVAGAPGEDSNATGVNGAQGDNSSSGSGAAYVFVRGGASWTQQAYLKASNTGNGDAFGRSVAVAGNRALVGADWEDSIATGIGGNQADNGAGQSGAAYAFVRSAGLWTQEAYLKASNTRLNSFFGSAAALSGNTALVGARWENSAATGINGNQNSTSALASGAAYAFTFDDASGGCTYSLSAAAANASSAGGSDSVTVSTAPGCAWTAVAGVPWITILSGSSGSGSGVVTFSVAANAGPQRSGNIAISGKIFAVTQDGAPGTSPIPSVGAPSPASGTGFSATFVFTFQDGNGSSDLNVLNVLINNAIDGRNACYLAFVRSQGTLLLVNDAGEAGGPFAGVAGLPGVGVMGNNQCLIDLGASSVAESGNTLTLTLQVTFQSAFAGNKVIYLAARDNALNNSGWVAKGVWTVPGGVSNGTSITGMTPARSTSNTLTLTTVFADTGGFADLNVLNILINEAIDGRAACYLAFVRSGGSLLVVDDAGNAGGPFAGSVNIPGTGVAANGQCSINAAASTVSTSGNTLTLTLTFTFTPAFRGDRIIYVAARDISGNNTGWRAMGTISVP
ncbi:MAG: hypothetical protein R2762_22685 [Bryobacteraceae bacterium]